VVKETSFSFSPPSRVAYYQSKGLHNDSEDAQRQLNDAKDRLDRCDQFYREIEATGNFTTRCDPYTISADIESMSWSVRTVFGDAVWGLPILECQI